MPDETDKKVENLASDAPQKSSDAVVKEVNQGRTEIVGQQKDYVDYLKQGGASGITDEFGKPMYLIAEAPDKLPDVSKGLSDGLLDAAKALKDGASDAVAELGKRLMPNADSGAHDFFAGRDDAHVIGQAPGARDAAPTSKDSTPDGHKEAGQTTDAKGDKPTKPGDTTSDTRLKTEVYKGEDIQLDVEPGWHTPKKDETLAQIARDRLGPSASEEEVKKYATEIAKNNNLDPEKPGNIEGKELNLPGHTKDGGYSVVDDYGNTRTYWKDGSEKLARSDGRTSERHPTEGGGYTEKHTGPRPDDNYTLEKTKDGKFLIADRPGDTPHEVAPGSEDVRVERAKVEALAEERIKDPIALAKFRADMLRFEERAAKQTPPLNPDEIKETYKQQEKLLTATGDKPLTAGERVRLAEQVMSNCANPTSIDQGHHNTCGVATVESRMYTRSPAEAARVVADVATTGKYRTPSGTEVELDPGSIKPCQDEARNNPPNDGERSHASQIFQVTAVNVHYQTHGMDYTDENGVKHHVPPGKLKYTQEETKPGTYPPETGERLYDTSQTPPKLIMEGKSPANSPNMYDGEFADLTDKMSGKKDAVDIGHGSANYSDRTQKFDNEEEMKELIAKAKAEGKMPIMISVHTGNEPFFHDSGGGKAGGSGGWHAVCITDYDEKTGRISVDNQWGSKSDHPSGDNSMSAHDLFMASRAPDYKETTLGFETGGTMHDLKKDIEHDRENGTIDTRKELELLRLQRNAGHISEKDYQDQLKHAIDDANERWSKQQKDGTFNPAEHDNAVQKMNDMTKALPPTERMDLLQKEYQRNIIKSKEYDDELVNTFREFSRQKPEPSTEAKQKFARKYQELLNNLPPERRQEIVDRA